MTLIVTGSIAFDCLMSFPGKLTEHFLPGYTLLALQDYDSVRVGPFCIVLDAPAVRGLGEFLLVHHYEQPIEREPFRRVPHQPFKTNFAVSDFAHLERDVTARPYNPRQFGQRVANHVLPTHLGSVVRDRDTRHIDTCKPAP